LVLKLLKPDINGSKEADLLLDEIKELIRDIR